MEDGAPLVTAEADVAVIGGGWAGCAAAAVLAQRGRRVALLEAAPVLGGRARRVVRAGLPLDNGQHLLIGAYEQTLALLALLHAGAAPFARRPLTMVPLDGRDETALSLRARALPAPFGLLAGLVGARGLSWRDRLATLAWFVRLSRGGFVRPAEETVEQMIAPLSRASRALWEPLCLAALNTPVSSASAAIFANVLRAAFATRSGHSDLVLPTSDLSALLPDAAARFVEQRGGTVATGTRARIEAIEAGRITIVDRKRVLHVEAAVVAVGPHQLGDAFAADLAGTQAEIAAAVDTTARLRYEPIATVYLGYPVPFAMPAPIVRLDDAPGQWLFDRRDVLVRAADDGARPALAQIVAVVLSAHGPHDALDHRALALACDAQLRRHRPSIAPLAWWQAIVERRATYACVPGRPRPARSLVAPGVVLAGDYVHATLPATLEAAVQSGVAAADALAPRR